MHRFSQIDVFTHEFLLGNPVAVIHDADDLTAEQMAAVARWTNLSETTFLLRPTEPGADYRLRIFTPGNELPFAGHPTLGSARAWLDAGGTPADSDQLVQQCAAGLIPIRHVRGRLAFAAPALLRSGPVSAEDLDRIARGLRIDLADVVASQWVDNGPGWVGILLKDANSVLGLAPDLPALTGFNVGVIGPYPDGSECAFEVRAFVPRSGIGEDPVTGSLNASLAQWLIGSGRAPAEYTASQGTHLQRRGRIHVQQTDGTTWVGGDTVSGVTGTIAL
ncbi:PhzF family phenazine biosynthesis protein [Nakamurella silvestris]|nr:PhzF family phenazine biosynthesis protein [Nakamurella silvestris]